jgi:DNA-binding response OmpR family regulator
MLTAKGYELRHDNVEQELSLKAVVAKPFSPRELVARVEDILQQHLAPQAAAAV